MASQHFENAFKNPTNRFISQRPKFINNGGYNDYQEQQYSTSNNEYDRRYYRKSSPYNDHRINEEYIPSQQPQPPQQQQQLRRMVISSSNQQTFTEINDRKRLRMECYYRGGEYQPPPQPIQRNYQIKRPCIDGRVYNSTSTLNQNIKPPVVLRPITRISKPQYQPHKVIQRFVDRHPNTIIMKGPNVSYNSNGGRNLQQLVVKPRNLKEDCYVNKLKMIRRSCRNMIFTNAAMVDEISRVNFAIQTITEEVQMIAKKVQHLERNKLRRYQQSLKREALSECKDKIDNYGLIPSHEINICYDTKVENNDKKEISDLMVDDKSYPGDMIHDVGESFEYHEDKSNEQFTNYDMDHDLLLSNDQIIVRNDCYQNSFNQYNNEHSIIL
uniref:BZIP domain-containing protein n=1 Tax=Strongyloides stercoralis TaxID=6248 RepID=A0A0K0E829_STRER